MVTFETQNDTEDYSPETILGHIFWYVDSVDLPSADIVYRQRKPISEAVSLLKVQELDRKIKYLIEDVKILQSSGSSQPIIIPIQSLGDPRVSVLKPFHVMVEKNNEDYIATWIDANLGSGGNTFVAAVLHLQSLICDVFLDFLDNESQRLGKSMRKQKQVMLETLCRTS